MASRPVINAGPRAFNAEQAAKEAAEKARIAEEKIARMDLSRVSNPMTVPPTKETANFGRTATTASNPYATTAKTGTYAPDFEDEDEEDEEDEEDFAAEEAAEEEEAEEEEEEEEEDEDDDDEDEDEKTVIKLVTSDQTVRTLEVDNSYTAATFKKLLGTIAKKCGTDRKTTVIKALDADGDVQEFDDHRSLNRFLKAQLASAETAGKIRIYVGDQKNPVAALTSPGSQSNFNGNHRPSTGGVGSSTVPRNPFAAAGNTTNSSNDNSTVRGMNNTSSFMDGTLNSTQALSSTTSITMPTAPGALLNWNRMKVLGKGSFGTVYEGITDDGKIVAVKTVELAAEKVKNEEDSDLISLRSEINLMTQLKHPHIVAYYGCQTMTQENGSQIFEIFMEHCHGGSLTSLRKKFSPTDGKLKMTLARHYTRQILNGLKYLHEHNVIHRDIKSDNVLISASGEAKLADFGCSKQLSTAAVDAGVQTVVGSPLFMAPEVLTGTDEGYSFSADIWSVGCLLLELLGRKPWALNSANAYQLMFQISQCKTMPTGIPANCPSMLEDFFKRVFERDASKRATAAELLKHPFLTCPDSELQEVEPPSADVKSDFR